MDKNAFALRCGLGLLAFIVALTALSYAWTPYDPLAVDPAARLQPASLAHPLGTDRLGRDILSLLMQGGGPSLWVAFATVAVGLGLGGAVGMAAALYPGRLFSETLMRGADFLFAFPALLSAALLTAALGPGLLTIIVAVGIFFVPVFARLTHAACQSVMAKDFIRAAQALGKSRGQIARDHILPNIAPLLMTQAGTQAAIAVLAEAALSYLGFGVQPPAPSWGRMLNDAQALIYTHPLMAVWPGAMIALLVLAFNLVSDGGRARLEKRFV